MRRVFALSVLTLLACPPAPEPDAGEDAGPPPPSCDSPEDCKVTGYGGVCRQLACALHVPCADDFECGLGETCMNRECQFTGCAGDSDCPTNLCRAGTYSCAECLTAADCPFNRPVCMASTQKCVECLDDSQCSVPGPTHCDAVAGQCRECITNDHCLNGLICLGGVCSGALEGQLCDFGNPCNVGLTCVQVGADPICLRACNAYAPNCPAGEICYTLKFTSSSSYVFDMGGLLGVCFAPVMNARNYRDSCVKDSQGRSNCQPSLQCVPDSAQSSTCRVYCDPGQNGACPQPELCHALPGDYNGRYYGLCYADNGWAAKCHGNADCKPGLSCMPYDDPANYIDEELSPACMFDVGTKDGLAPCSPTVLSDGGVLSADSQCKGGSCRGDPMPGSFFPSSRSSLASVQNNGYLYVVGGKGTSVSYSDVWFASIKPNGTLGSWSGASPFLGTRYAHASVTYNDHLYVIGGFGLVTDGGTATTNLDDVQVAPINSDGTLGAFAGTTSLPAGRQGHASVAYNGFLYVIGGSAPAATSDIQMAPINSDGTLGAFTATTPLPGARSGHAAAVYNGFLYVVGGTNVRDVLFAPINANGTLGTFTPTASFATVRRGHASVISNGFLYVIGGITGVTLLGDIQVARIAANGTLGAFVTTAAVLPDERNNHAAVAYNGTLYVLGGLYSFGTLSEVQMAPLLVDGSLARFGYTRPYFCYASCAVDSDCSLGARTGTCDQDYPFLGPTGFEGGIRGCRTGCLSTSSCDEYQYDAGFSCQARLVASSTSAAGLKLNCTAPVVNGRPAGASCASNTQCSGGLCSFADARGVRRSGVCVTPCQNASDCAGSGSDTTGPVDCLRTAYLAYNGRDSTPNTADDTLGIGKVCSGVGCKKDEDCSTDGGARCVPDVSPADAGLYALRCRPRAVATSRDGGVPGEAGAPCGLDLDCWSGVCAPLGDNSGKACFQTCDAVAMSPCPSGLTCKVAGFKLAATAGNTVLLDGCAP